MVGRQTEMEACAGRNEYGVVRVVEEEHVASVDTPLFFARSVRAARLRVLRTLQQLLGGRLVAAKLRDFGQVAPRPRRQLPVAEVFGDSDREPQVLFRL